MRSTGGARSSMPDASSPDGLGLADPSPSVKLQEELEEAEADPDEASLDAESTDEESDWRHEAMAIATQLAPLVHKTWMLPEGKPQAAVTTKLLRAALEPEQTMAALSTADPLASVRLLRLAHRQYHELGDETDEIMMPLCLFAAGQAGCRPGRGNPRSCRVDQPLAEKAVLSHRPSHTHPVDVRFSGPRWIQYNTDADGKLNSSFPWSPRR
jgi:hypothetical protein